jgi:cytochrome P450
MPQDVFELPAPEGKTIVGHLLDLSNDPLGFLTKCRDYGDIVPLRLGLTDSNQVVKESMRLYPPVAVFGREAAQDCTIGDYEIHQGTVITISQWVMHRHPQYFDNPEVFEPERWTEEFEKNLPRGVYIPFGDGPRVCIGKGFAQMEAGLLLATIAQRFELDLEPGYPIVPQPSITLRPEYGIKVKLKQIHQTSKSAV